MEYEYLIFVGLHFLGLLIRAIYEQLKKSGRVSSRNRLVFAIILCAMCLMWASWFNMCPMDPYPFSFPSWVKWIGFGIFLLGLGLSLGALIQLKGVENISHFVTTGLFSRIRHPMYIGFILWILGWAVFHGALFSLLIGFVALGNVLYWIQNEDRELQLKYGEIYLKYRQGTWF
jgi:protein-S-isoprenylcysteine O-methyltransferase Ste14